MQNHSGVQSATHRRSGILLHPTSFPSPYGIGDIGQSAYDFIDFLEASGQELWQVLPIGPTGYGDSPYQSFSSFAGQPLIINPEDLITLGLLSRDEIPLMEWDPIRIDYGPTITYKTNILKTAYANFTKNRHESTFSDLAGAYTSFCQEQVYWLDDYALFMAAKDAHDGAVWTAWDHDIAFPTPESRAIWTDKLTDSIDYYRFIQFIFYREWFDLKAYANKKNIAIIGDIPIFVAFDSADVWANKSLFYLDDEGHPTVVAGVPPDYFSETGQLWGNPLYNWEIHKENNYDWWIKRIEYSLRFVDYLRIDHFRGFESFWAVPYGMETAMNGQWWPGPKKSLFFALEKALGKDLPIIAEDLGVITPAVEDLRDHFHFPGMKILQFAFEDLDNNYFLPHNYLPHTIAYTGTHDNDTTLGWYMKAKPENQDKVRRYMNTDGMDICWDFIRTCLFSVSDMAIIPLQDILSKDSASRMNTPGVAAGNWNWRYQTHELNEFISNRLKDLTDLAGRGKDNIIVTDDEDLEKDSL